MQRDERRRKKTNSKRGITSGIRLPGIDGEDPKVQVKQNKMFLSGPCNKTDTA